MPYALPARCRKTYTACKKCDSQTARCPLQRNMCFLCAVKTAHCVWETQSTIPRRLLQPNICSMRGPKTAHCAQDTMLPNCARFATITTKQWESYIYLSASLLTILWQSFGVVTKYVKLPESECYTDDECAHNNFRNSNYHEQQIQ